MAIDVYKAVLDKHLMATLGLANDKVEEVFVEADPKKVWVFVNNFS